MNTTYAISSAAILANAAMAVSSTAIDKKVDLADIRNKTQLAMLGVAFGDISVEKANEIINTGNDFMDAYTKHTRRRQIMTGAGLVFQSAAIIRNITKHKTDAIAASLAVGGAACSALCMADSMRVANLKNKADDAFRSAGITSTKVDWLEGGDD